MIPMSESDKRKIIETAADTHDVDLERAVVAEDQNPESDRIYLIECIEGEGYRLVAYGLDADGNPANEEPIIIPETAVGPIQGLLHAAGLHVTNQEFLDDPNSEARISIRDMAEGMGLSKPLETDGEGW